MLILRMLMALDRLLIKIETFLLGLSLSIMLIFSVLQVFLRNFFDSGIEWGDIVTRHSVLFVLFFGASITTRQKGHLCMDFAEKILPKKSKPFLEALITTFAMVITAFLFVSAYKFTRDEKLMGDILFLNIPSWVIISIMPVGFGLIFFHFFMQMIEMLLKFSGIKLKNEECLDVDVNVSIKI